MLKRVHNAWRRPVADWRLFASAWVLLALMRMGLRVLPFATMRRWAEHQHRCSQASADLALARVNWAVGAAVRTSPGGVTCLPVALLGLVLLRRQGCPAELRIGVARGESAAFEAHAWVECEGRVIFGAMHDLPRFIPFPALPALESQVLK